MLKPERLLITSSTCDNISDGFAVLVGVVSRGGQCAGFNQPGIYTNVANEEWNKWIRKEKDR
jgi:secreted trypsin-like serine protease